MQDLLEQQACLAIGSKKSKLTWIGISQLVY